MKKRKLLLAAAVVTVCAVSDVYATFSIVAVDSITGAVGSAGASCIANSQIINDVVEGVGAVNTQSFYLSSNQVHAHNLLIAGILPDSIMQWLEANDAEGDATVRQYGAVTLFGPGLSAAFTGGNCFDWHGHNTGPGYSIQGNILIGPQVVDSMEFVFLNTSGPLEDRLMAALEAAKIPGADSRCFGDGKSSISAFIKVVHLGDGGTPYLYEVVPNTAPADDPIDLLRVQYDNWKVNLQANADNSQLVVAPLALRADGLNMANITIIPKNLDGDTVRNSDNASLSHTGSGTFSAVTKIGKIFVATLTAPLTGQRDTLTASVDAGGANVELSANPVITFYPCGDINADLVPLNILDLTTIVDRIFRSGPPFVFPPAADLNGDGAQGNILDLTKIVDRIFRSGPPLNCGW